MSADQQVHLLRAMLRWVYTERGTIVLSVVPFLLGIAAIYEFYYAGGAIFLVTGIIILVLVIRECVRVYRHRNARIGHGARSRVQRLMICVELRGRVLCCCIESRPSRGRSSSVHLTRVVGQL